MLVFEVSTTPSLACPQDCACSRDKENVVCRNGNAPNVIRQLSPDTSSLTYYMKEPFNETGLDFSHLIKLQKLVLTSDTLRSYEHMGQITRLDIFSGLESLTQLEIHIGLRYIEPKALVVLKNLQVLDISFVRGLHTRHIRKILGEMNRAELPVHTLNLTNFQYPSPTGVADIVDLNPDILRQVTMFPLKALDISWNGLINFTPGFVQYAPNLTLFRSRGNIHSNTEGTFQACSLVDIMLHPKLEEVELGNDNFLRGRSGRKRRDIQFATDGACFR